MEMNFDPMTGEPISTPEEKTVEPPKKGGGFPLFAAIAAAAVVVIIALVAVGCVVASGAFLGKGSKVAVATVNTFKKQGAFVSALQKGVVDPNEKFTLSASGSIEDVEFATVLASAQDRKQFQISAETSDMPKISGIVDIDQEKVQAACPEILDYLFVYNFTEEKDGYLVDQAGEKEIEALDESFQRVMNQTTDKKLAADYRKKMKELFATLSFQKEDAGTYKVDGKDRKCAGISVTIDEDFMLDMMDLWQEYAEESMGRDAFREAGMNDLFKEGKRNFRDMPDIDITFYLYKKQLAAVYMEAGRSELEIIFHGGDYRTQNVEVLVDGDTVMELTGKQDGTKEKMELFVEEEGTLFELEFNKKTGAYTLEYANGAGGISGTIESAKDGVTYSVKELYYGRDSIDTDIAVSISKGADFEKLSGEIFDIGNASEDDFNDLYEELKDLDEFKEWFGTSEYEELGYLYNN